MKRIGLLMIIIPALLIAVSYYMNNSFRAEVFVAVFLAIMVPSLIGYGAGLLDKGIRNRRSSDE